LQDPPRREAGSPGAARQQWFGDACPHSARSHGVTLARCVRRDGAVQSPGTPQASIGQTAATTTTISTWKPAAGFPNEASRLKRLQSDQLRVTSAHRDNRDVAPLRVGQRAVAPVHVPARCDAPLRQRPMASPAASSCRSCAAWLAVPVAVTARRHATDGRTRRKNSTCPSDCARCGRRRCHSWGSDRGKAVYTRWSLVQSDGHSAIDTGPTGSRLESAIRERSSMPCLFGQASGAGPSRKARPDFIIQ
jgi:hypothetical protein